MTPVTIGQLALYNPQRISDELSEKLFIIRKRVFALLMKKISDETKGSIPQHHLIIGLRGMGKSTLLKRMEVALRSEKYRDKFIPLLPPEEQYNISNLGEFWLNSLDALANTLELEQNKEMTDRIDNEIRNLETIRDPEKSARETYKFFKSISEELGRRPVLLIDNLNLAFDRFSKPEQHKLRAWLMENNAPILVGASAITIDDTLNYDAPFYDAFQQHYIRKLTFGESMKILTHLAQITGSEEILPEMNKKSGRLRTIHHLTGGNPRTAVLLFRFIAKGFSPELKDDLDAMLDEITPLYKHRFESLSLTQQKILDAIALNWDPISLPDLRQATRLENNQLSPQIKRLYDSGWIDKLDAYKTKGHAYQMSERFFNIWFLMRRSSRRQKRALISLSKFLECFYGEKLNEIAKIRLKQISEHADDITLNLAIADALDDHNLGKKLKEKSLTELKKMAKNNSEIKNLLGAFEKRTSLELRNQYFELCFLKKDYVAAEKLLHELVDDEPKYKIELGKFYQYQLNDLSKAEKIYYEVINNDSKNSRAWHRLGHLYGDNLKRYSEAENAYKRALEINPKDNWICLGNLYMINLNKYSEAEDAYLKAIEINKKNQSAWFNLGILYQSYLNRYKDAEKAYKQCIKLNKNHFDANYNLGMLYSMHLQKPSEAEKILLNILKFHSGKAGVFNGLGNIYQDYLKNYNEAEKYYLMEIERHPKSQVPKYNLVFLYRDKLRDIEKAREIFDELPNKSEMKDSYLLNKALFDLIETNLGLAEKSLSFSLFIANGKLPEVTRDDWMRFASVVIKLGYADWLLSIMEDTGNDINLAPYYTAIKAINEKDTKGYLNSRAVEIREPARQIIEMIKRFE